VFEKITDEITLPKFKPAGQRRIDPTTETGGTE